MDSKFCMHCGNKLTLGSEFCLECGKPAELSANEKVSETNSHYLSRSDSKKPLSLKRKLFYWALAVVFTLLVGTHFLLTYMTDSERQLRNVYNAIVDGNEKELFAELNVPQTLVYDPKTFTKSLKQENVEHLYEDLSTTVRNVKKSGLTEIVQSTDGIDLFRIKKEKMFGLYPKMNIEIVGHGLTIHTDLKDSKITIANSTYELEGKDFKIPSIANDNYDYALVGKNEYFESSGTGTIEKSIFEGKEPEISLLTEDYSIALKDAPENSILYINQKSTKKTTEELKLIQPVFGKGTTFYAVRKLENGNDEESDTVEGMPGDTISFSFPLLVKSEKAEKEKAEKESATKKVQAEQALENNYKIEEASYAYVSFRDAYVNALNYEDFSYVESYLYGPGKAFDEIRKFINETEDSYFQYNFITNEVLSGEFIDGKVHLHVMEVFLFENHVGEVTKYERKKEYVLLEVSPSSYQILQINISDTKKNKG